MKVNRCIKNLLQFINVLQRNSLERTDWDNNLCLEKKVAGTCYNTRVISLFNCQGKLIESEYLFDGCTASSSVFRIQDVQDDCCTLLILRKDNDSYISTGQCIVVDIGCICAVKCLGDEQIRNL